jgi:hypothetical protein
MFEEGEFAAIVGPEDVLRALGASKWDIVCKVGIPRDALLLRLTEGGDHAGLRRLGDQRVQQVERRGSAI